MPTPPVTDFPGIARTDTARHIERQTRLLGNPFDRKLSSVPDLFHFFFQKVTH